MFDNRFPSLGGERRPTRRRSIVPTAPAHGHCEVVVYTQDPRVVARRACRSAHIELLLQVWADRTERLGARGDVAYVLPFENRGAEVGVTLHHPHGQIYAYPVVPPVPARMQQLAREHHASHGRGLLEDH